MTCAFRLVVSASTQLKAVPTGVVLVCIRRPRDLRGITIGKVTRRRADVEPGAQRDGASTALQYPCQCVGERALGIGGSVSISGRFSGATRASSYRPGRPSPSGSGCPVQIGRRWTPPTLGLEVLPVRRSVICSTIRRKRSAGWFGACNGLVASTRHRRRRQTTSVTSTTSSQNSALYPDTRPSSRSRDRAAGAHLNVLGAQPRKRTNAERRAVEAGADRR